MRKQNIIVTRIALIISGLLFSYFYNSFGFSKLDSLSSSNLLPLFEILCFIGVILIIIPTKNHSLKLLQIGALAIVCSHLIGMIWLYFFHEFGFGSLVNLIRAFFHGFWVDLLGDFLYIMSFSIVALLPQITSRKSLSILPPVFLVFRAALQIFAWGKAFPGTIYLLIFMGILCYWNAICIAPACAIKSQQSAAALDRLVTLKKLLDDGLITQEEFDSKRKELLDQKSLSH